MGAPGQRVTSRQDVTTEVQITLQHAIVAAGVLFVLALTLRYAVIVPAVRCIGWTWLVQHEPRASWWLCIAAGALPFVLLAVSFCAQVININWPPPYSAANPRDGFWGGMFRPKEPPLQSPAIRPEIDNQVQRAVPVEILIRDDKGNSVKRAKPALTAADWQRLARYFARGGRSVSQADLERAGFSGGPNGRAREVNRQLTNWRGLTGVGDKKKPMAVTEFAEWVMQRGYAADSPLPSPE
jgi:hypothetical protein